MFRKPLFWGLFLSYIIITLVFMLLVALCAATCKQMVVCVIMLCLISAFVSLIISRKISEPIEKRNREFVANVSHELRTPITSIKGFIETLLDGAIDDKENAERFLRIAARQSDRLNLIVDDLLTLSRLEQDDKESSITLDESGLQEVLQNAVQLCEFKAKEKNVKIELECGEHLRAKINAPLLEQAIANLIDNAIKYSPSEDVICVEAKEDKKDLVIHVRDKGCGINKKHFRRLFERFYRIDKARSRELGGTGLGLSIVKHIVNLHHGKVFVNSEPDKGSTFSIYLPKA